jgi:hypothetical protein
MYDEIYLSVNKWIFQEFAVSTPLWYLASTAPLLACFQVHLKVNWTAEKTTGGSKLSHKWAENGNRPSSYPKLKG